MRKLVLFAVLLAAIFCLASAQPMRKEVVSGTVYDLTGKSLEGIKVVARGSYWRDIHVAETDASGYFELKLPAGQPYTLYFYSPRGDYVPAYVKLRELTEKVSIEVKLVPAAAAVLEDSVYSFYEDSPAKYVSIVVEVVTGIKLEVKTLSGNFTKYGNYPPEVQSILKVLNLSYNTVYVPEKSKVRITVKGVWKKVIEGKLIESTEVLYIDVPPLQQGSELKIYLSKLSLKKALDEALKYLNKVNTSLTEAVSKGFYLEVEKRDLSRCKALLEAAAKDLERGRYLSTFAYLRQAKAICLNTENILREAYQEASRSAPFMILLASLISTALALYSTEKKSLQILLYAVIFAVLLTVFYATYPGIRICPVEILALSAIAAPLVFAVAIVFPVLFKEKPSPRGIALLSAVTVVFSMAKRNLRRRRLLAGLAIVSTASMVWALVVLTSYASIKGVVRELQPYSPSYTGVLVKSIQVVRVGEASYRIPSAIPAGVIEMIKSEPGVSKIYVRYSSIFTEEPLTRIVAGNAAKNIYGVLALSLDEAEITGFNKVVSQGRLPSGRNEIALPDVLAEALGVSVGSEVMVFGKYFTISGILDSNKLSLFRDIDNRVIYPLRVYVHEYQEKVSVILAPVKPEKLVLVSPEVAKEIGLEPVSVLVKTEKKAVESLTEKLAYLGLTLWYTVGSKVYRAEYGEVLEVKGGATALIPVVIVVLNIFIIFISAVYQRKQEVVILSSIGVNPTHITMIFIAEALVLGIIASGIGYAASVVSYKVMAGLQAGLQVRQKVSAVWGVASIISAITVAALGALYPAYKSAFIVVPSMLRRFRLESEVKRGVYEIPIPLKIPSGLIEDFVDFAEKWLNSYSKGAEVVSDVLATEEEVVEGKRVRRIVFTYEYPDGMIRARTMNELEVVLSPGEEFWSLVLKCTPIRYSFPADAAYATTRVVRKLVLEWSSRVKIKIDFK